MDRDSYNSVEFYRSGETRPFCIRLGILNIPRIGDGIDVFDVRGEVSGVTWNMDYFQKEHERWRCNVYIKPASRTQGDQHD